MSDTNRDPMLDLFIFETNQLLEKLEQAILSGEQQKAFTSEINEIFRIMHTIKGGAAMMLFNSISTLAHSMEDIFYAIREGKPAYVDYQKLSDLVLAGIDFIRQEIGKIEAGVTVNGDATRLIEANQVFLDKLKEANPELQNIGKSKPKKAAESDQKYYIAPDKVLPTEVPFYKIVILFQDDCQMENTRAFTIVHHLKDVGDGIKHIPRNIIDDDDSEELIRKEGFKILIQSDRSAQEIEAVIQRTPFIKSFEVTLATPDDIKRLQGKPKTIDLDGPMEAEAAIPAQGAPETVITSGVKQNLISVQVDKLDELMDLVGELVISEAMVTRNPDLAGKQLKLDSFHKAARQLRKITSELQDIVMSIRMVPLAATFQKMQRLVRDMKQKLNRDVELVMIGQETEVDKNIIEHLGDPLMHMIRNAIDHGIEPAADRIAKGKPAAGKVILEAKHVGSEVWVIIQDDGWGLDREKILTKARENNLITKAEDRLTDREVFGFIMLPGFSTKENVSEYSGRGVGMDVVTKNIEKIGGTVLIDSVPGEGSTFTLKIPLTLAIVDGMTLRVGASRYTAPTTAIKESFRMKDKELITDPDGNEMVMVRNQCFPILRLHELFKIKASASKISEGIVIMIEHDGKTLCLFADELLGEQQVVVKGLPSYLKKVRGISGCTLLGDGGISLILDTAMLVNM